MRKTIAAIAAGVLIIGGAAVASAQVDESTEPPVREMAKGEVVAGILADLVEDGTITQVQADAITEALEAKRAEFQAMREERRAERQAAREALEEAWSDDVLTLSEAESLPFADRLTDPDGPFAEAWEDGELTKDEVQELRGEFGPRRGFGHRGFGGFGPGSDAATEEGTALDT